ncbi:PPE family protein, SVP subgroup [Candidatus Mycobacterium methanotrophicum]|nr:PE domain-containing protein [Candidatus Mycobacterium methanotrophicum]
MSYVNTAPAAISTAASQLEGIGSSFAAESSAAAGPTTAIAPSASDEVSILQSGVFSTYGQLYQTVSAQAEAIHQQFVNLLQTSSGSYQETEAANQAGTAANSASSAASSGSSSAASGGGLAGAINSLASFLGGNSISGGITEIPMDEMGNFASAYSDMIGMGGGGLLTTLSGPSTSSADLGGLGAGLAGDVGPATAVSGTGGVGAMGAAPVLAAAGSGSSIGPLSVPPSWAGGAGVPTASTPVTLASQSWTTAAPTTGGMGPGIAGMPAVANSGRGGTSFGAPRYGVKPKVMPPIPKPTLT